MQREEKAENAGTTPEIKGGSVTLILPEHPLPAKPRFMHGQKAPCPVLRFENGRTYCGFVLTEEKAGLEPIIARALGIDIGCTMNDEFVGGFA